MNPNSPWSDLIVSYRKKHALTQAGAAQKFHVSQQTISRWESGKQEPDQDAQTILRGELGILSLTLKEAWIQRVNLSAGRECLLDKGWRFIAVSPKIKERELNIETDILGKALVDFPILHPIAAALRGVEIFSGGAKLVRLHALFHLTDRSFGRTFDLWPIVTGTDEILVHAIAYPFVASKPPCGRTETELLETLVVPTDQSDVDVKRTS